MDDIFGILRDQALKKTKGFKDEDFIIRGLWKVDLAFKPNVDERTFRYWFLVSQTIGQGSCYCDKELEIDQSLIGRDAREIIAEQDCYSISVLDSIYASIPRHPERVFEITGNSIEKAVKRNAILLDEVERTLAMSGVQPGQGRVLNVGVLGNLIKLLTDKGHTVIATDLDEEIVDKPIHGVTVEHGSKTFNLIKDADVAVITGMTLTTHAAGDIVDVCKEYGTKVVMFAETGAYFGEEYCQTIGIDAVVSEPFPFYIFQGTSRIEIYRRHDD
ncbi:MAG: DUF364 domain-containing protein [Candidatus Eisenbacteria bacterium]